MDRALGRVLWSKFASLEAVFACQKSSLGVRKPSLNSDHILRLVNSTDLLDRTYELNFRINFASELPNLLHETRRNAN